MIQQLLNIIKKHKKRRFFNKLIRNGNLIVGRNTNIENLHIFLTEHLNYNTTNIVIGDDCLLEGTIILYNNNARVSIGNRTFIGKDTTFYCYDNIEIGDDIMFSWGITVMDTNAHSLKWEERKNDVINWKKGSSYKDWTHVAFKKITIHNKAWIGFNSIILKGVEIGEGAVVAAGSVVTKNVQPFTIVGGNPAQFIKETE